MMAICFQYRLLLTILLAVSLTKSTQTNFEGKEDPHQQHRAGVQLQQALTPEQWTRKYWCDLAPPNSSLVQSNADRKHFIDARGWLQRFWYRMIHDCNRDQNAWIVQYIDELMGHFKVLVQDSSIDERLANMFLALSLHAPIDRNYFRFNSGDPEEDRENQLRVAGPSVNDSQCELDLIDMSQQLDELNQRLARIRNHSSNNPPLEQRHIKMARVLDAFGRYESGTLSGLAVSMGFFDQCIKARVERSQLGSLGAEEMKMRYCWAQVDVQTRLHPLIKQRQRQSHESLDENFPVATCLPKSCHSKNLNSESNKRLVKKLLDSQFTYPESLYLDQRPQLDSVFCLPDDDTVNFKMPLAGKIWIVFTSAWILVCGIVTYFNIGQLQSLHPDKLNGVPPAERAQTKEAFSMNQLQQRCHDKVKSGKVSGLQQNKGQEVASSRLAHQQEENNDSSRRAWRELAKCFNLSLSWREFSSDRAVPSPTAAVDLDTLNPIKVFACFYATASHALFMHAINSNHLIEVAAQVERDRLIQAALATSTMPDTFLVISGLLISYISCRRLMRITEARQRQCFVIRADPVSDRAVPRGERFWFLSGSLEFLGCWLMLAANRYLRLVPLLAFMFFFRRDVFTYLGSGPLWDYGFNKNTMTGACNRASSLVPFTLDSLSTPLNKQCIVTAWTVSNDILFGFLIPPFLLLLQSRPKLGLAAMYALVIACSIYGLQIWTEQPNTDRFEMSEMRMDGIVMIFNGLSGIYTTSVIRATDFFIGAIAGLALFNYARQHEAARGPQKGQIAARWPGWLRGPATKLSILYLVLHLVVALLQLELKDLIHPYHRLYMAYLMTLDRTVWSAANAILLLRITTDWRHGPWVSKFAGQKWKSLARLNYPLLLVHWIIILLQMSVGVALPSYTIWNLFSSLAAIYMASLPLALILHVVFENPFDKVIKKQVLKL